MRGIWWLTLIVSTALACEDVVDDPPAGQQGGDGAVGGGGGSAGSGGSAGGGGETDAAETPPDAGTGGDAAPEGPDAAPKNPVGSECESEHDCESNFCLDTEFARALITNPDDTNPDDLDAVVIPNGYCTMLNCLESISCGGDPARCIDLPGTGIDVPFNACFRTCDPEAEGQCRDDHTCYCDADGNILDVEGNRELCLCLPQVLEEFLSGG